MQNIQCPFCESLNVRKMDDTKFECAECSRLFDAEDIRREKLRHRLSPLLSGTSEESPRGVSVAIGEEEACGLSSLELPEIREVFLFDDGTMWFHVYGGVDVEGNKLWENIDHLSVADLEKLVSSLERDN